MSTKNAWHTPDNGKASHWHDAHGIPICGAGWFTGRIVLGTVAKPCKRCTKLVGPHVFARFANGDSVQPNPEGLSTGLPTLRDGIKQAVKHEEGTR